MPHIDPAVCAIRYCLRFWSDPSYSFCLAKHRRAKRASLRKFRIFFGVLLYYLCIIFPSYNTTVRLFFPAGLCAEYRFESFCFVSGYRSRRIGGRDCPDDFQDSIYFVVYWCRYCNLKRSLDRLSRAGCCLASLHCICVLTSLQSGNQASYYPGIWRLPRTSDPLNSSLQIDRLYYEGFIKDPELFPYSNLVSAAPQTTLFKSEINGGYVQKCKTRC